MNKTDATPAADRGSECNDQLGPPPVGALTVGEEALLRAWADRYATKKVAAERERSRHVVAYMATSRKGTVRFTDNPDAARELEGYGWAITPLADAGPNAELCG